jgi:ribosomal protein L40E
MIRDAQQTHDKAGGKDKTCSKCSRVSPSTAKFCGKCGSPL